MAASVARGVSRIQGARELRVKESDRLAALATNLRIVGIEVEESTDGLTIRGGAARGGVVDARGDHRIAMAFAVLGTMASAPITVRGAREIETSYPGFVETLTSLGARVEADSQDALTQ
jgi:3-phosphoshikimate 1-carboxyvinyltransferase